MMPVLCVLDANVIIADRRLGSASARTITSMAEAGLIRLAIPEVALKEVVQNSLEVLDKARRDLKAVRRSIGPLCIPGVDQLDIDVESGRAEFENWLLGKLRQHGISILPIPKVSHEMISGWAIRKRRPFKESGAGYKDALIWATVLSCSESEPVLFVSANSSDFAAARKKPSTLHSDLDNDLLGPRSNSVTLVPSLADLVEIVTPSEQDVLERLQKVLSGTDNALRTQLIDLLRKPMLRSPLDRLRWNRTHGMIDELNPEDILEPVNFFVSAVSDLGDDDYLVQMDVEADVDLRVTWWESEPVVGSVNWDHCHSTSVTETLTYPAEAFYSDGDRSFRDASVGQPSGSFAVR